MSLTKPVNVEGSTITPTIEGKTLRYIYAVDFTMSSSATEKKLSGETFDFTVGSYLENGVVITDVMSIEDSNGRKAIPLSHTFNCVGDATFLLNVWYDLADTSAGATLTDATCRLRIMCFR